jgi:hypothetical protein
MLAAIPSVDSPTQPTRPASSLDGHETKRVIVIHGYQEGLSGVRAANPDVKLSLGHDAAQGDEPLLVVDYPPPGADPASRDVVCEAMNRNWTAGRAIAFRVKPSHALMLSVSFMDRNRVAYTARMELKAAEWQTVRIPFDTIRPNPYFQPANANTGTPIDVSDVMAIAFAPRDETSGHLAIGEFVVVE